MEPDDVVDLDANVASITQQQQQQQASSLTLLPRSAKLHLFRLIRLLVAQHNPSPWYLAFILLLQTMQILSYPFGKDKSGGSISHSAATALMVTNLRFLDHSGQQWLLAVVLFALLFYGLMTALFALRLSASIS